VSTPAHCSSRRADPPASPSPWGAGSALDNAVSETFNSTLEFELLRRHHFVTRAQARHEVATWIDEYDTDRRHSTNGMLSPVDFERACAMQGATKPDIEAHSGGRAA
jgi:putative transposase